MSISVLILTLNEEINLPGCLESVSWCDDIAVLDSFSSDRTKEIATATGCRCEQRQFDDYASQRNFGLNVLRYKNPWVLMLDADERLSDALRREIEGKLSTMDDDVSILRVRRKDYFLGKWLRRSSGYPTWFGRLFRPGQVRVRRKVNEEYHTDGRSLHLQEHLLHYPFNKGISFWLERHNRYSSMEAAAKVEETRVRFEITGGFSKDPVARRKALKQLAYRLPARPLLVFAYLYFLRQGFRDGRPGLIYCLLRSWYEFMIDVKVLELRRRISKLPV